jgi:hypothetical protein
VRDFLGSGATKAASFPCFPKLCSSAHLKALLNMLTPWVLTTIADLWYRPDSAQITTEQFKIETRNKIQAVGYVIIANVGDQKSDLAGGFAERAFKLPAPRLYMLANEVDRT